MCDEAALPALYKPQRIPAALQLVPAERFSLVADKIHGEQDTTPHSRKEHLMKKISILCRTKERRCISGFLPIKIILYIAKNNN